MSKSNKSNITWCSDNLHDVLGYSDTALSSYLSSVASSSSSHKAILKILHDGNVKPIQAKSTSDADSILENFARQLHQRCWKGSKDESTGEARKVKQHKRKLETNGDYIRKASKYKLVDMGDDDAIIQSKLDKKSKSDFKKKSSEKDKKSKSKDEKKSRRRRYKNASDSDSGSNTDGETNIYSTQRELERRRMERRQRQDTQEEKEPTKQDTKEESKLTTEERANLERDKDIEERDAFVKRMTERDSNQTKQKTQAIAAAVAEKEERLARGETILDSTTGNEISLGNLREESRRAYLKKREERELTILEKTLKDEEVIFDASTLTEKEKRRMELQKNILKMARKRDEEEEEEGDFYKLPDEYEERSGNTKAEKDEALLVSRYKESKQELTEQELWEVEQANRASKTVPIASYKLKKKEKEYDFVFDDSIDFGLEGTKEGYDDLKRESVSPPPKALTEHEKILAGRKKLPVYPYRNEFLAAVKQNQILILVGETGSGKTTQIPQVSVCVCVCVSLIRVSFLLNLFCL